MLALAILGLLGMHSISNAPDGEESHAQDSVMLTFPAPDGEYFVTDPLGSDLAVVESAHCANPGCGSSSHGQTGMLMICVLALLSVAIFLSIPRLLPWLQGLLALAPTLSASWATKLPPPRPPSLIFLSISRT
ncbi:DUF6153 family protein [Leucobacter coleopterorum]|uniref:DUF6153 family protein n=1 Tax=Leucobacter coleopterorum TaxID=2714933 RepID=UPI003CC7340C